MNAVEKESLAAGLRECRKLRIGDTLHIVSPEFAEDMVRKALRAGRTVTENGISIWHDEREVINAGKSGSEQYVWKGDKIQFERIEVTKDANGNITRKSLGFFFGRYQ